MPVSNNDIAKVFEQLADLSELRGDVVFKVRAYQRAARAIEAQAEPLEQWVRDGRDLKEIPGVGKEIANKITELVTTGRMDAYERARAEFPEGVLTLMDIPGVGPKTAHRLTTELGVSSVEELERAIVEGRVAAMPRLGQKAAENILRHIRALGTKERRIPLGKALPIAEQVIASFRGRCQALMDAVPVGSMRRWKETVGDIDIIALCRDGPQVLDAFISLAQVVEVLGHGEKKASVVVTGGLQMDLRVVEPESFGAMLQYFTGSKEHNVLLREYARRKGLSLNEFGITDLKTERQDLIATEEAFYARLGLPWIPPELREGGAELESALAGALPRLLELGDLKGDLHVHSDWTDGRDPIEVMLAAAKARGYEYVALTDHSVGRGIANGLSVERLRGQRTFVRQAGQHLGIKVFHGSEVDIRADGTLDFPDDVLAELDVVVASVHSAMGQDRDTMTQRIVRAMRNPHVTAIGHPTTRLIGERPPVEVDMEAVIREAARTGVALEINASPDRMDLKDTHVIRARELGAPLVINSDAHRTEGLDVMRFGVANARRGWCEPRHIMNTRPQAEFTAWLKRERARSRTGTW
ncbi:MAG: DNA polymerase/3'-5' exonuclease PolX [SAR202 cluster bacterium]|nr:DNA polymerase/3'-5' exonuclease PolX [SAR202 cluster bacterium]